jgi:hypothetical protein
LALAGKKSSAGWDGEQAADQCRLAEAFEAWTGSTSSPGNYVRNSRKAESLSTGHCNPVRNGRRHMRGVTMNHSIYSADRTTHLKIVVVALLAGLAVAGLALSSHVSPPA